jgi:hypothetical protein
MVTMYANVNLKNTNKNTPDRKGVDVTSVDLVLSGDMLNSFDESTKPDDPRVTIEIAPGEVGKAHGNITGSYGKPRPNPEKARDFFGFTNKKDLKSIIDIVKRIEPEDEQPQDEVAQQQQQVDLAELRQAIQAINISFEDFE